MSKKSKKTKSSDVPHQIFDTFLTELAENDVPDEVIARLRTALIEERNFGDRAIEAALLPEDEAL